MHNTEPRYWEITEKRHFTAVGPIRWAAELVTHETHEKLHEPQKDWKYVGIQITVRYLHELHRKGI
jgi:hypothetical protein